MKFFAVIAIFFVLAASITAISWEEHNHHGGHHQHGKVGYNVDVHHGGWGHNSGLTELYDSRDKTTGWGSYGHNQGRYANGWEN